MEARARSAGKRGAEAVEARLGRAVDYLEARLDGSLGPAEAGGAAEAAGWSKWHFMRVFEACSGMPVAEYVRARRLARAARALAGTDASILGVALEVGYESQAAFSRAFSREFGLSPSAYRRASASGQARRLILVEPFEPRLPFEPPAMIPDIEECGPLALFGITTRASVKAYKSFSELPRFWDDWMRRRRWRELALPPAPRPLFGLCGPTANQEFEYAICLEAPPDTRLPQGWRRFEVDGGLRAVFRAEGPQPRAIQEATLAAYARWLPASGMARGEGFDLEVYHPGSGEGACRSEVRIPLSRA